MVVVRLKRMGRKGFPFYRIVVADSRVQRDGKVIEELGYYSPKVSSRDKIIKECFLQEEKYKKWISQGASPSDAVKSIARRLQIS